MVAQRGGKSSQALIALKGGCEGRLPLKTKLFQSLRTFSASPLNLEALHPLKQGS